MKKNNERKDEFARVIVPVPYKEQKKKRITFEYEAVATDDDDSRRDDIYKGMSQKIGVPIEILKKLRGHAVLDEDLAKAINEIGRKGTGIRIILEEI